MKVKIPNRSCLMTVLAVIAFLTMGQYLSAQARQITGTVVDAATYETLIGVNVSISGTTVGTITDATGSYSINASEGQSLVFSYVGYETQTITLSNQTVLDVSMSLSTERLDEVVVVGYGTMKRSDITGAVSSVREEDIATTKSTNAIEALQGKVAGVDMVRSSGAAGSGYSILLRGARSLTASNSPIYIVDGVEYGSNININPNDIASMEVLKDASSTAIYGSRGANGVILITTKKGQVGKPTISFNTYYGITTPLGGIDLGDREYFLRMSRDSWRVSNNGWDIPDDSIPVETTLSVRENEGYEAGSDYDWVDAQTKDYGTQQDYHFSVVGGNEGVNYGIALDHMIEDNFVLNDKYKRYSIKFDLEGKVTDWLNIGNSSFIAYSNQVNGRGINYNMNPLTPAYDSLGVLDPEPDDRAPFENPLIDQDPDVYLNEITQTDIFSTFYAQLNLFEGLSFRTSFNFDLGFNRNGFFQGEYEGIDRLNSANMMKTGGYKYTWQNILTYSRDFGDHNLLLTGATETIYSRTERAYNAATDLLLGSSWWWTLTSGQSDIRIAPAGDENYLQLRENALQSFIGRAHYGYKSKYLVTVTGRYDGASQLAEKWAFFPSASLAWRISEESFIKNINAISNLKIRFGYGLTGNQSVQPYAALGSIIQQPMFYEFGVAPTPYFGYRTGTLDNPDLTWETTAATNVGLDFGFLRNRISGSVELYQTHTSDLLQNRTLPPTSAVPSIVQNVGETKNKGIEVTLRTVNVSTGDFTWSTDITFAANREEITALVGGVEQDIGNGWFVGYPVSVYYDYEMLGIWQTDEADQAALYGRVPGDFKLRDVNNDTLISDEDRVILGNPRPKWTGGLNSNMTWKNFDLNIFVYARVGHMVNDGIQGQWSPDRRENSVIRDYWTPNNPTNDYPRLNPTQTRSGWSEATVLRWRDGSFVKIPNITLGYTLPAEISQKAYISKARFYVTLKNYFAFGKYYKQGRYDPEYRGALGKPIPKMVAIGANLTF